jgi:hypothetical protein
LQSFIMYTDSTVIERKEKSLRFYQLFQSLLPCHEGLSVLHDCHLYGMKKSFSLRYSTYSLTIRVSFDNLLSK